MAQESWQYRIDPEESMSDQAELSHSMIMRELEEADVNVGRLAELLNALEKRLRPVLIEVPMTESDRESKPQLAARADEVVSSPLSERVRNFNTMMVRAQSHLGQIMSRVDF